MDFVFRRVPHGGKWAWQCKRYVLQASCEVLRGSFWDRQCRCINRTLNCEEFFTDGQSKLLKPRQETFSGKTIDVSNPRPAVDEVIVVRECSWRLWYEPDRTHAFHWSKQAQTTAAGVPADLLCNQVSSRPDLCRSRALDKVRCALLLPWLLPLLLPSLLPPPSTPGGSCIYRSPC